MDTPRHKQGERYDNEEDRREGLLEAKRRYANKEWTCEICSKTLKLGHKARHLKSKKHINNK